MRFLLVAMTPLLLGVSSCMLGAQSGEFGPGRQAGIVRSDLIREASGIVASRQNPGVLWVHNDSGDSARIFAINEKGEFLGTCEIAGATARDWEDIAVGPGPYPNRQYLYIGDIGDNRGKYPDVTVYRVAEPKVDPTSPSGRMTIGPADAIRFTYPGGPRDAETLLVDPLTRDLYILSKREFFSKVYQAPYPQSTTERTELKQVAALPWGFAVAGDVSPDGRRVIIRGMFNASLWDRAPGQPLWQAFAGRQTPLPLMQERQGEGICFDARGTGYFTIGEMERPPLHFFGPAEPEAPRSSPSP
ncbi:MAG TPA: hypothetical protein VLI39_18270 [Sedimentisphaerales bacterium]|nr:hypothetical protein [Sedimentisphaerales bacterium]